MSIQKRSKILIVDDEIGIRDLLSEILNDKGYATSVAHNAETAWKVRNENPPDLILLDIWMPDTSGITLLQQWRDSGFIDVPVIVMSGHATIDTAVQATQLGALDVLEKPIAMNKLLDSVEKALKKKRGTDANPHLQQTSFGESATVIRLKKNLLVASVDKLSVFFVGAANSGAPFFAQYLSSPRSSIIHIESGSKLEGNIDDILRKASNGIIIVRSVEVYSKIQQNGLLGLLREAGKSGIRVAVCSTEAAGGLAAKGFGDILVSLLSRNIVPVPSLSDYKEDIPTLARLICRRFADDTGTREKTLTPEAVKLLVEHDYENDFAELSFIVRSALLYGKEEKIASGVVKALINKLAATRNPFGMSENIYRLSLRDARELFERKYFYRLITITDGNIQKAANMAGLERTYFYRRLKHFKEEDEKR